MIDMQDIYDLSYDNLLFFSPVDHTAHLNFKAQFVMYVRSGDHCMSFFLLFFV